MDYLLSQLRGKRILVVGDVMLDKYLFGFANRLSPEGPFPVVEIEREEYRLGGAANVAHNVASLGGSANLITMSGFGESDATVVNDQADENLRSKRIYYERILDDLCRSAKLHDWRVYPSGREITLKTRIYAGDRQLIRIDDESCGPFDRERYDYFYKMVKTALAQHQYDALIFSDYDKGVLTPEFITKTIALAKEKEIPVIADPKYQNFGSYKRVDLLTPNESEVSLFLTTKSHWFGTEGINFLFRYLQINNLLITEGDRGMTLFEQGNRTYQKPANCDRPFVDSCGAGDVVTAAMGLGLASGVEIRDCIDFANYVAGISCSKLGTYAVGRGVGELTLPSFCSVKRPFPQI